eukprot:3963226-Pleurochrysis_carterae.AAC.3
MSRASGKHAWQSNAQIKSKVRRGNGNSRKITDDVDSADCRGCGTARRNEMHTRNQNQQRAGDATDAA